VFPVFRLAQAPTLALRGSIGDRNRRYDRRLYLRRRRQRSLTFKPRREIISHRTHFPKQGDRAVEGEARPYGGQTTRPFAEETKMFVSFPASRIARRLLIAAGISAGLAACYVIPMNPDGSPAWQYLPPGAVVAAPAAPPPTGVPMPPSASVMPSGPSTYQARLYPMNDRAAQYGQLVATITDLHTGRGMLSMNFDGEFMSGEATRVSDTHPGFGTVYERVLKAPIQVRPGQPKGIANATGSRGTWINCEYVLESAGRGTGACLMSNGAAFQIHFGS